MFEKWTQKMLGKVISSDSSRRGVGEEKSLKPSPYYILVPPPGLGSTREGCGASMLL